MAINRFTVQESEDRKIWYTVKHLCSVRDCYLEIMSYDESFRTKQNQEWFEWNVEDEGKKYFYRILDVSGLIVPKKQARFDPRTSLL